MRRAMVVTSHLPFDQYHQTMNAIHSRSVRATLISLEAAAVSARGGFACLFSTSDEYETAVISGRHAQGRYRQSQSRWPLAMFAGCALMLTGAMLLLH
jgi:hypothetical protein